MGSLHFSTRVTCLLYKAKENNNLPQNLVTICLEIYISSEQHQHRMNKIIEWSKNGLGTSATLATWLPYGWSLLRIMDLLQMLKDEYLFSESCGQTCILLLLIGKTPRLYFISKIFQ